MHTYVFAAKNVPDFSHQILGSAEYVPAVPNASVFAPSSIPTQNV